MPRTEELTELLKSASAASLGNKLIKKRQITARAPAIDQMQSIQTSIQEVMPVSGETIRFKFLRVNPELVDVHPDIPRQQKMLTLKSVSDIFDSIRDSGQREPCLVRPKEGGRFELIDGSRRFFCVRALQGNELLVKSGDIPDEDVGALFEISDQKLKHSDWEKGIYYLKFIPCMFTNKKEAMAYFAEKENVSETTIFYRMQIAELPDYFVSLYDTPNNVKNADLKFFTTQLKRDEVGFREKVEKLREKKLKALSDNTSISGAQLLADLKKSLVEKVIETPSAKKTVVYRNSDNKDVLKYRVNPAGNHVFETIAVSNEEIIKIKKALKDALGIII